MKPWNWFYKTIVYAIIISLFMGPLFIPVGDSMGVISSAKAAPIPGSGDQLSVNIDQSSVISDRLSVIGNAQYPIPNPQSLLPNPQSPIPNPPIEPDVLAQPISISRVQSSYQAGSNVVITFTVTNNQPITRLPNIPDETTITDTIEILSSFVITRDANSMHAVILVDSLTISATYVDSSFPPVQNGSTYTWTLGDIPPQSSRLLTLTVQTPANASDFTALDTGAIASGKLWDLSVLDVSRHSVLAPDTIDPAFLDKTIDADIEDEYMLWKSAEFTQDPLFLFEYVRGFDYNPYAGSLRGTRGTLWNAAGNSLDQSSLLIAMLRASGVPARYRHGTLDTATAQTLIASMFPDSQGVAGYLPAGTEVADPTNDLELIALVSDHWWVEAYLPGSGWTNLDPSFTGANVGDLFVDTVASDGTDRIAEVPDTMRHKVTIRLKVEQYHSFPISSGNFTELYPLEATFSTVELAAKQVTLGHIVETDNQGGLVFANVIHTYVPYFTVDGLDVYIEGDPYIDTLTNFPLSSSFTSGQWLEFEVLDVDGTVTTYMRTVKDLIGADNRITGGAIVLSPPADSAPLVGSNDLYATWFLPNTVPNWVATRRAGKRLPTTVAMARQAKEVDEIEDFDNPSPEEQVLLQNAFYQLQVQGSGLLADTGLYFAQQVDKAMAEREESLRVKQYFASPRIFTIGSVVDATTGENQYNVDLRKTDAVSLVYPGQAKSAVQTANWVKGVTESSLEGTALEQITGEYVVTTYRVFEAMAEQGIEATVLDMGDLSFLESYDLSPAAYVHAFEALLDGKQIIIPSEPVTLDGELTLGWWEVDPESGVTIGVTEDGLHGAATELSYIWKFVSKPLAKLYKKVVKKIWEHVVAHLEPVLGGGGRRSVAPQQDFQPQLAATSNISDTWRYLSTDVCPHAACGIEQFFTGITPRAIPLPEMLFTYMMLSPDDPLDSAVVSVVGSGGGDPAFTLSTIPPTSTINPNTPATFQAEVSSNYNDTFTVTITAPGRWNTNIDTDGQVTVAPPRGTVPTDYSILAVAQSHLYPQLFSTTIHTVTITSLQDMRLVIANEPYILVPADGSDVPGLAHTVNLSNTSTVSHTFAITISGHPTDQIILNGVAGIANTTVSLPAGAESKVGLYILPPPGEIPPAGTEIEIEIEVETQDDSGLGETVTVTSTIPYLPIAELAASPAVIYATENSTATFEIDLTNVGNAGDNFPLTITLPITTWEVFKLLSPLFLTVGETSAQSVVISLTNANLGDDYQLRVESAPASTGDADSAIVNVEIVSADTLPIFETSIGCNLGDTVLSAALEELALAVLALEESCDQGTCSLSLRDAVVAAIENVAMYADEASSLVTEDTALLTIANEMGAHTDDADLLADISSLSASVTSLGTELCDLEEHLPSAKFIPLMEATLPGLPVTYTLEVKNRGTVTTTYEITVTLPTGSEVFSTTINPDSIISFFLPTTATILGFYTLYADVVVSGHRYIRTTANAGLNVVDRFVQVTAVNADPAFVETGVSSTTVSMDVTNIADLARTANARSAILAPTGVISWTADSPINILAGSPRSYELGIVNTSGWNEGVYTITVNLLDDSDTLIPSGYGFGYLGVGQALAATQSVFPKIVAPGTVTVTTMITTAIQEGTRGSDQLSVINSQLSVIGNQSAMNSDQSLVNGDQLSVISGQSSDDFQPPISNLQSPVSAASTNLQSPVSAASTNPQSPISNIQYPISNSQSPTSNLQPLTSIFTRTEQNDASIIYSGIWTNVSNSRASGGNYYRSSTGGDTASFGFNGTWVGLGFLANRYSGLVEVFVDGSSERILDLYRREEIAQYFIFDNLISATHTISLSVLDDSHPNAVNDYVQLDFIDTWNGDPLADGTYEQDDARVFRSTDWTVASSDIASGGSYLRGNTATGWFPFTGDSVSLQAIAYYSGGVAKVFIDGNFQAFFDLYNPTTITRTLSFTDVGEGLHVLQINSYRTYATMDTFTTPGSEPFYEPPAPSGIIRYEENHPALLYNGVPFTQTTDSWWHYSNSLSSGGYFARSDTVSDTVSLTFDGTWVGVGFATGSSSGMAEIFIDGISQGIVDTYRRFSDGASFYYDNLVSATHTISITVLGDQNPNATNDLINLDFIDVWDGNSMPEGTFEALRGGEKRIHLSTGWTNYSRGEASEGSYVRDDIATAWFPFVGDSVSYQAMAYSGGGVAKVYLDGHFLTVFDLYNPTYITRTLSFTDVGTGPHVLQVSSYRGFATIDTFSTPGSEPFFEPPKPTGIIRYEEDHPALLYNGVPLTQTATSWWHYSSPLPSAGYYARSESAGDTVSLTFDGTWVGVGFATDINSGMAEIFIDGISQGVVDNYRRLSDISTLYYADMVSGTHTISITVLGDHNPNSKNDRVNFDYIDVWDGSSLPEGTFEVLRGGDPRIHLSTGWRNNSRNEASEGSYVVTSLATAWFPFVGDSVSYQALAYSSGGVVKVYLDGQFLTIFDLYNPNYITRTLSFTDVGSGPHVLQVSSYRSNATIDTFSTPGYGPFYEPPTPTGLIRYQEDNLALLYNGVPYTQTATSWTGYSSPIPSGGYYQRSETAGDTVSLTFDGTWVGVGFATGTNSGMAEIFIDGISQGVVDNYTRVSGVSSVYYHNLVSGTHTISITVLGTQNPIAKNDRVNFDFIDVWDGTLIPEGTFEALRGGDPSIYLSTGWSNASKVEASQGSYVVGSFATAWFPFTGDSVSYQALAYSAGGVAKVYLDGQFLMAFDLYNPTNITRTLSFTDVGSGPHILQVSSYRGNATIDTFSTPGSGSFYEPPIPMGVIRYEEDNPALLYNRVPFTQTTTSWIDNKLSYASRGYTARSETISDSISLSFDGTWVGLGFAVGLRSGFAEIFIDGLSMGVTDLYSPTSDVAEVYFTGLTTGTHTISITVLGQSNPNSLDERVNLDYIDVWDGSEMAAGWYEADSTYFENDSVDLSTDWRELGETIARGGIYYDNGSNMWFRFTGDSVTYLAISDNNADSSAEVFIDGISQGVLDLTYDFSHSPLPFHYTGLGDGAHVIRVHGIDYAAVDAFEANPVSFYPGVPMVEWYDDTPAGGSGVFSTPAAGDLDGDGDVEIAVSSSNGNFYLYRGDGGDAGGGTPILWQYPVGNEADAPALVELDGNPGAEIIVGSLTGIYAFHDDGTIYWFTDTVRGNGVASGAAVGNLDHDNKPEIVVAATNSVVVLEHDGSLAWEYDLHSQISPPILADITGDGYLDILVVDGNESRLHLIDYTQGFSPTVVWTHIFTSSLYDTRGAPAVANIDGLLPGGDDEPEIIVATNGFVHVINHDGSLLWMTPIGTGTPGGISISDTDGDGEVEIITTIQYEGGRMYVLNADGSLLWDAPALDNTSGTSASTHDLDGDGIWEVIWNGATQGLTIYNGPDGEILFNEPAINSISRKDYPVVVDVDGDGHAEIVTGDPSGFYVVGFDTHWAESRSLWNEYNYHVTNINDDLSMPPNEPNSWKVHNTYRTQTPLGEVLPVYQVALTHTVGISDVTVLTDTFSAPVDVAVPNYYWTYSQYWYQPTYTTTYDSLLSALQPGDTRMVNRGTDIAYTLPSGSNQLSLPPLFVDVASIVSIDPISQTVGLGGLTSYTLTLSNPGTITDSYTLTLAGLSAEWIASLPPTVTMPAETEGAVSLDISVPANAGLGEFPFLVQVTNQSAGSDQTGATLHVIDSLHVSIRPPQRTTAPVIPVTYTLTISNLENIAQTYNLTVTGSVEMTLPPTVTVAANTGIGLVLTGTAVAEGPHTFTVIATSTSGEVSDRDNAVLEVEGNRGVTLDLSPRTQVGGPGTTVPFTLTLTNIGSLADSYDLSVSVPPGWSYSLDANGTEINEFSLAAHIFNAADLSLLVLPGLDASAGNYVFTATARSQTDPGVSAVVTGTVEVLDKGVQVSISPKNTVLDPTETGVWQVVVTNTGSVADNYNLTTTGIVALSAVFSPTSVVLDPGQSQSVQMTATDLTFALPQTYPFAVGARSQTDDRIQDEDRAEVTVRGHEDVALFWYPASQTVTDTLSATFLLVITNTGNMLTDYQISIIAPQLNVDMPVDHLAIPAHLIAGIPVIFTGTSEGTYTIQATADSANSSDSVTTTLTIVLVNKPPSVDAGEDQSTVEGSPVNFEGSASDPESDPLSILWDFGDGFTVSDTLTLTHTYLDDGIFTVTLTVTDTGGLSDSDSLTVTVDNVPPTVYAGPDKAADEGQTLSFTGVFTDPGVLDTFDFSWDFGDGTILNHTLTPTHVYGDDGSYTVTLTVSDDDGAAGDDSLVVTVTNVAPIVYAGEDQTVEVGQVVYFTGTFTDAGISDTHTIRWALGDGYTIDNDLNPTHTYTISERYPVTLTVTDDDGGVGTDMVFITVNEPPVVEYKVFLPLVVK